MAKRESKGVGKNISGNDAKDVEEQSRLTSRVIYEIVRVEGEEDLARPMTSLWWSGLAAGLSISFSLLTQAILTAHLPNSAWRPLVTGLGYSVGFVMVVLARQQLFTENTITVVLPLLAQFSRKSATLTARLWSIVLTANIAGTLFAAAFCTFAPILSPEIRQAMIDVSTEALAYGWWEMLFRGIAAGFLIAAMVWLIPSAEGAQFHVVVMMTYLIAIGGFTHIVAGSMEAFMLLLAGHWSIGQTVGGFMVPVLIGNVIGGTALFALISYAQVMEEM
ncbi:MAG TPA: formate/nitrite transporter family protein [Rhizomicrobium sp.]|jgi:formate/nitrite transporter FocA (FNT family)|nr:formate/nitrite transporter family protein [Rhizomicrobium sp.]